MGFRFRKSFKVLPGVRVNVTKKGISSVSVGKPGASVNIGKRGTRASVGLPGTGLSYHTKIGGTKRRNRNAINEDVPTSKMTPLAWVLIGMAIFALMSVLLF